MLGAFAPFTHSVFIRAARKGGLCYSYSAGDRAEASGRSLPSLTSHSWYGKESEDADGYIDNCTFHLRV